MDRGDEPDGVDDQRPLWECAQLRARLVAFARRFVGDAAEAEDVAQEALHRASVGSATLRSADRAEAWVFRICRHAAIDHVRARRVRQGVWGAMPDGAEDGVRPTPRPAASERPLPKLDLRRLPAHQRLLVVLHYERGLSQSTICRMTGLSASALRVRLFRARLALAKDPGATGDPGVAGRRRHTRRHGRNARESLGAPEGHVVIKNVAEGCR